MEPQDKSARLQPTRRYFLPGKEAGSEVGFGVERGSGRYFLYLPNPDTVSVDEGNLSTTEMVALLREYGKRSQALQMVMDAFTMNLDLDGVAQDLGLSGVGRRAALKNQKEDDQSSEETMMEKHDVALLPVEIARMRAAGHRVPTETREAAGGLYGYTKRTQRDVEATVRKAQKYARKIAAEVYSKDPRIANFMNLHSRRAKSSSAKLLVAAMKELGPKFASRKAKTERLAGGLYGMPTKTARLGLQACADLRAYVGELAFGLHMRRQARYAKITGFMQEHAKTARCGYTRMLLGCYPDAPRTAGKLPDALEEHQFKSKGDGEKKDDEKSDKKAKKKLPDALKKNQFTSKDNPNPKGSDADGDGKTNEKKPFDEKSKKKANWDPDQIGDLEPPAEHESDEPYMATFNQNEFDELSDKQEGGQLPSADKLAADLEEANLAADLAKWASEFNPEEIGKTESGALEKDGDESYMTGHFTEEEGSELSDKQESWQLPSADKMASFGFAHKPLMEAKKLVEEGDKKGAKKKLDEASKLVSQLSSSKANRARDFMDDLRAKIKKMGSAPPPPNSVQGWIEWEE